MKQMLEGAPVTERTQLHLDRCLTCRACETTCPSGVRVRAAGGHRPRAGRGEGAARAAGERAEALGAAPRAALAARSSARRSALGRALRGAAARGARAQDSREARRGRVARGAPRAPHARARRAACSPRWRPRSTPPPRACSTGSASRSSRRRAAGCCGAVSHHLNCQEEALGFVRANIDAWWPHVEAGAEAIVITASGCGTMVADYGHLLRDDAGLRGEGGAHLGAREGRLARSSRRSAARSPTRFAGEAARRRSSRSIRPAACSTG